MLVSLFHARYRMREQQKRRGRCEARREKSAQNRLAHKSSFWARSATVSAKRDRTSAKRERANRKPSESWESLRSKKRVQEKRCDTEE